MAFNVQQSSANTTVSQNTSSKNATAEMIRLIESKKNQLITAFGGNQAKYVTFESNLVRLFDGTDLKKCSPISVFGAAIQAAYLNLDIDPILGQAYVIAREIKNRYKRNDSDPDKITTATFQTGYQGLIELIRRSGELKSFNTVLVYDKEDFSLEYTVDGIQFRHTPKAPSQRGTKIIGGYLVAQLKNGGSHFEWMWVEGATC